MKILHIAILLSASLLVSSFTNEPARAQLDLSGAPSAPITGPVSLPFLDETQLLSDDEETSPDVVAVGQVFSAYEFFHDSGNGMGVASLFMPNGIFEIPLNTGAGILQPNDGVGGKGCIVFGHDQLVIWFNGSAPLPFPGHTHHVTSNKVVKINGNTAALHANFLDNVVDPISSAVSLIRSGEYMIDFICTDNGWKMSHNRAILDAPVTSTNCDLSGSIPR